MLFHVGYLVAPNNVVVRTADTDVLIIALANMEKCPAAINVWLKLGLHTNNTNWDFTRITQITQFTRITHSDM